VHKDFGQTLRKAHRDNMPDRGGFFSCISAPENKPQTHNGNDKYLQTEREQHKKWHPNMHIYALINGWRTTSGLYNTQDNRIPYLSLE